MIYEDTYAERELSNEQDGFKYIPHTRRDNIVQSRDDLGVVSLALSRL